MPQPRLLAHQAAGQNSFSLPEVLAGPLNLDKYGQIIKPFLYTKSAPDNLASEIRTKANTEAVIMILDKNGVIKYITNKFFLDNMQISMREKFQLMETFGAANISFFGEAARVYTFSANTVDAPSQDSGISQGKYYQQSSILKMYNEELRGSQLIKKNRVAVLKTANHLIYGYPLNLQIVYNAHRDPVTRFSLQFIVAEHSLELPGVVTENYLSAMYSVRNHINNKAIFDFIQKIEAIKEKIGKVLDTQVGTSLEPINELGDNVIVHISNIHTKYFKDHEFVKPEHKLLYTSRLTANVIALQTEISSVLDGEISPLVHSKVPPATIERLLALISTMFDEEEVYNSVAIHMKSLIDLRRELVIFSSYRE